MEKVNISGLMENTIQASGKMVKNMEVAIGNLILDKAIWASGLMVKFQGKESEIMLMGQSIKESFLIL